jgi:glyoxylase-like metal-dependent hydrolase (beta-lactamase superfamily II)
MSDGKLTRRGLFFAAGASALGVAVVNTVAGCTGKAAVPSAGTPSPGVPAPVPADIGGWQRVQVSYVAAYLLVRGNEVAVVDLGTPGSQASIEEGLRAAGSTWAAVRHVILTHQHEDHVGGLGAVSGLAKASYYAGVLDRDSIVTDTRLVPVEQGDEVFGLRIVDTPGHTLGHISVFDPSNGVLVAGDALRTDSGPLTGSDPRFTADASMAARSVKKLARMDVKAILPGHGNPVLVDAAGELRKLAASL